MSQFFSLREEVLILARSASVRAELSTAQISCFSLGKLQLLLASISCTGLASADSISAGLSIWAVPSSDTGSFKSSPFSAGIYPCSALFLLLFRLRAKNIAPTSAAIATIATPTQIQAFSPDDSPSLLDELVEPGAEIPVCELYCAYVDMEVEPEVVIGVPFEVDAREDVGFPVTVVRPRLNVIVKFAGAQSLNISFP